MSNMELENAAVSDVQPGPKDRQTVGRPTSTAAKARQSKRSSCPFRKLYPAVLVVQSSQDRNGEDGARTLDCSMQGRIFL